MTQMQQMSAALVNCLDFFHQELHAKTCTAYQAGSMLSLCEQIRRAMGPENILAVRETTHDATRKEGIPLQ